jgi:multidrug efflux pump subunit AcrB
LISKLTICCVFVPVFFLQAAARLLFTPMARAVVFATLASYGNSRILTPIVIRQLLRAELSYRAAPKGWFARLDDRTAPGRPGYFPMHSTLMSTATAQVPLWFICRRRFAAVQIWPYSQIRLSRKFTENGHQNTYDGLNRV